MRVVLAYRVSNQVQQKAKTQHTIYPICKEARPALKATALSGTPTTAVTLFQSYKHDVLVGACLLCGLSGILVIANRFTTALFRYVSYVYKV